MNTIINPSPILYSVQLVTYGKQNVGLDISIAIIFEIIVCKYQHQFMLLDGTSTRPADMLIGQYFSDTHNTTI